LSGTDSYLFRNNSSSSSSNRQRISSWRYGTR